MTAVISPTSTVSNNFCGDDRYLKSNESCLPVNPLLVRLGR